MAAHYLYRYRDARPGFNFNTIEWLETFDA